MFKKALMLDDPKMRDEFLINEIGFESNQRVIIINVSKLSSVFQVKIVNGYNKN